MIAQLAPHDMRPTCRPLNSTRLTGLRVGAFWDPDFPALISFPGPAWLATINPFPGLSSKIRQEG
jgi:hypothetical protein